VAGPRRTCARWPASARSAWAAPNCHLLLGPALPSSQTGHLRLRHPRARGPRRSLGALGPVRRVARGAGTASEALTSTSTPAPIPGTVALTLATTRTRSSTAQVILGQDRRAGWPPWPRASRTRASSPHRHHRTPRLHLPGQAHSGRRWPVTCSRSRPGSPKESKPARPRSRRSPTTRCSTCCRGVPGAPDLSRVDVVQPALWAVMVSLAGLWRASGVSPEIVIAIPRANRGRYRGRRAISLRRCPGAALRSRAIAGIAGGGGMLSVAPGSGRWRRRSARSRRARPSRRSTGPAR